MQDDKLLSQYARDGSEAAFGQLVSRHLTLVYSTCLREIGSPALAEDAAQVVFLLLARKAKSLHAGPSLAGWLYKAARFVSKDVRKQEARRRLGEDRVMQETAHRLEAPAPAWERVEPLLNDALSALKPGDREAVLLRFIEGHSLAETGAALGVSEDAARMRVSRAVEKMRQCLAARGAVVSGAALVGLLTSGAARPVPADAAALSQGTLQALSASPNANVLLLSKGVYQTMKIINVKFAALAAVFVLAGSAIPPLAHALSPRKPGMQGHKAGMQGHKAGMQGHKAVSSEPLPLVGKITAFFTLDKDQRAAYRVTLPAGVSRIVLDTRRADGKWGGGHLGNVTYSLSYVDKAQDGTQDEVINQHGISTDFEEVEKHAVDRLDLHKPGLLTLNVHNSGVRADYWLTVVPGTPVSVGASPLTVPLFGKVVPKPMALGEDAAGRLEKNGYAYFHVSLKAGTYQSSLHFSSLSAPTALNGDLALMDEEGGGEAYYKDINELHGSDAPYDSVSTFTLKKSGVFLLTISNQWDEVGGPRDGAVNYVAKITSVTAQPLAGPAPVAEPAAQAAETGTLVLQHTLTTDLVKRMHWDLAANLPAGVTQIEPLPAKNALAVTGTHAGFARVRKIVKALDVEPKQVQIQFALAHPSDADIKTSGVQFELAPLDEPGLKPLFVIYAAGEPAARLLQALTKRGAVTLWPDVTTTNDVAASFNLSTTSPTQEVESSAFAATPRVNSDGSITLALHSTLSSGGAMREVSTVRTVKSGDTMIIVLPPAAPQTDGKTLLLFVTPTVKAP